MPGDEFWLNFSQFPTERSKTFFNFSTVDPGMEFISIRLAEKRIVRYSTSSNPCSSDGTDVLKSCIQQGLKKYMGKNCTLPGRI